MRNKLEVTEYCYRGHWIALVGSRWQVYAPHNRARVGAPLFASLLLGPCPAHIDGLENEREITPAARRKRVSEILRRISKIDVLAPPRDETRKDETQKREKDVEMEMERQLADEEKA